jgi:nucleoside-diphosphate-sugar epimerase
MKYVVTGGTGFIGSNLIDQFISWEPTVRIKNWLRNLKLN